jgi:hypothetical protein
VDAAGIGLRILIDPERSLNAGVSSRKDSDAPNLGQRYWVIEVGIAKPVNRTVRAHQGNGAHVAYNSVIFNGLIRHRRAGLSF